MNWNFNEVRGQAAAIEALVAVAEQARLDYSGSRPEITPVLLGGPPGSGKLQLAKRLVGILPDLQHGEAFEAFQTRVMARMVQPEDSLSTVKRPFRAPHHTVSDIAMTGKVGTRYLSRPGECALAHGGVLYLDEVVEFRPNVLRAIFGVSTRGESAQFPANFWLVMGCNPCPCGGYRRCACSTDAKARYQERIDHVVRETGAVVIDVASLSHADSAKLPVGPDSETLKARVEDAWENANA